MLIILALESGRQIGCQEHCAGYGVPDKRIKHGIDLPLARVGPDRSGKKKIETRTEYRGVEIGIEVKARLLERDLVLREQMVDTARYPLACRLNSAIAAGIQKSDQPISSPQATATDVQNLRFRTQALLQQSRELISPALLEARHRNAHEAVVAYHCLRKALNLGLRSIHRFEASPKR